MFVAQKYCNDYKWALSIIPRITSSTNAGMKVGSAYRLTADTKPIYTRSSSMQPRCSLLAKSFICNTGTCSKPGTWLPRFGSALACNRSHSKSGHHKALPACQDQIQFEVPHATDRKLGAGCELCLAASLHSMFVIYTKTQN